VIDRLRQPEGRLAVHPSLGKRAQFRQAPGQEGTGRHHGEGRKPKALPAPRPAQGRDIPPEYLGGLLMVAQGPVALAQGVMRDDLQADIPQIRGNGQRALGGRQAPVQVAQLPQRGGQSARDLAPPAGILQALGQGFGLAQVVEEPLVFAEGHKRTAQG
jgi:hypothetical protein